MPRKRVTAEKAPSLEANKHKLISSTLSRNAFPRQGWDEWKPDPGKHHYRERLDGYICARDANGQFIHNECIRSWDKRKTLKYLREKYKDGEHHKIHKKTKIYYEKVTDFIFTPRFILLLNGKHENMIYLHGEERVQHQQREQHQNIQSFFMKQRRMSISSTTSIESCGVSTLRLGSIHESDSDEIDIMNDNNNNMNEEEVVTSTDDDDAAKDLEEKDLEETDDTYSDPYKIAQNAEKINKKEQHKQQQFASMAYPIFECKQKNNNDDDDFIKNKNFGIIKNWFDQQHTEIFKQYLLPLIETGKFQGHDIKFDECVKYIKKRNYKISQKTEDHLQKAREYNINQFNLNWNNTLREEQENSILSENEESDEEDDDDDSLYDSYDDDIDEDDDDDDTDNSDTDEVDDDDDTDTDDSDTDDTDDSDDDGTDPSMLNVSNVDDNDELSNMSIYRRNYINHHGTLRNAYISCSDTDDDEEDVDIDVDDEEDESKEESDDEEESDDDYPIITPVVIPDDMVIPNLDQIYRTKLICSYLIQNYYNFNDEYYKSYFVKRRNREIYKMDHREGKWVNLFFPDLIKNIVLIDNEEDKQNVLNQGNDDIEFIYNKYKTECNQRKEEQLFNNTASNIRASYVDIKDFLIHYIHEVNRGILLKQKIISLLSEYHVGVKLDSRSLINIIQELEEIAKCHKKEHKAFWIFWDVSQSQVHSSSNGVEGFGNWVGMFAAKVIGKSKNHKYIERKTIIAAHLDGSEQTTTVLSKGLAHRLVDNGRGVLQSNASRDIKRRKYKVIPKVILKQMEGKGNKKYCHKLFIDAKAIRFNKL